jgi:hypothetical protein
LSWLEVSICLERFWLHKLGTPMDSPLCADHRRRSDAGRTVGGAYRIGGIRIVKTGAKQPTPFFSSDYIELAAAEGRFKGYAKPLLQSLGL